MEKTEARDRGKCIILMTTLTGISINSKVLSAVPITFYVIKSREIRETPEMHARALLFPLSGGEKQAGVKYEDNNDDDDDSLYSEFISYPL